MTSTSNYTAAMMRLESMKGMLNNRKGFTEVGISTETDASSGTDSITLSWVYGGQAISITVERLDIDPCYGVSVDGVDVGGSSTEEMEDFLEELLWVPEYAISGVFPVFKAVTQRLQELGMYPAIWTFDGGIKINWYGYAGLFGVYYWVDERTGLISGHSKGETLFAQEFQGSSDFSEHALELVTQIVMLDKAAWESANG